MKIQFTTFLLLISLLLLLGSCKRGPKIISSPVNEDANSTSSSTGIFSDDGPSDGPKITSTVATDVHTVKVLEVLPTEKYVYLKVVENEEEFWVATGKKEIKVGETYFYKNGILKTNFESKEYNRIFDKVYLVSNIVASNHSATVGTNSMPTKDEKVEPQPSVNQEVEGSIKIAEIIANPQKYEGQSVQVSGTCNKLNPNIMGRNWIHLKDGSQDDYDFVLTSEVAVPEGHFVTMTGKVVLDKDFGAGYRYAIILEEGQVVKLN